MENSYLLSIKESDNLIRMMQMILIIIILDFNLGNDARRKT